MDLVPDATAISSLIDLLGAVLQLTAAVLTLLAAASVRRRRSGPRADGEDDDAAS
ncbi:hypothetical protein V6V47_03050 [Micromonospora sp. CPCC 205539]|uniref:hypothetical protein n=1 Tax=Micromonospora sp. CPCC 205539 TaxID=3122408 RepID=UPI002FEEE640